MIPLGRGLDAGAPEVLQLGHILTQAVGLDPAIEPEVHKLATRPGDIYLMCSDGLSDLVPDAAISAIVAAASNDLDAAANALIATALSAGGHDNVTVVLVRHEASASSVRKKK